MPLTAKGEKIKSALEKEYGSKKGEQVLYAGKNAGTFTGIDAAVSAMCDSVDKMKSACGARADDHRVIGGVQIPPTAEQIENTMGMRFDAEKPPVKWPSASEIAGRKAQEEADRDRAILNAGGLPPGWKMVGGRKVPLPR